MPAYLDAVVGATHNSYSPGRGTLAKQFEVGVRFMELDVRLKDREYVLGHGFAGHEVADGDGNPAGIKLSTWLAAIAKQRQGPLTIALDVKQDLTKPDSFAEGNLGALNAAMRTAFGDRLLTADELGDADWPAEMAERVVWVLSGDEGTREGYLGDGGRAPAVALNGGGRVVEVHASRRGDLWYWTGRHDGGVTFKRHGRIGDGRSPAVALTDDGHVVVIHAGGGFDAGCTVGRLDAEDEIAFKPTQRAALPQASREPAPVVRLIAPSRLRVTYETDFGRRACEGTLDPVAWSVDWDAEAKPATGEDARFHANLAQTGGRDVSVSAVPWEGRDGERLVYGTDACASAPIRYEQLAFVEAQWFPTFQRADDVEGRRFLAANARDEETYEWLRKHRQGRLVRMWNFEQEHTAQRPNFPATNDPRAAWYREYLAKQA